MQELIDSLQKKEKLIAMLAPSFVVDFSYHDIVLKLRKMGFDKVVEMTYGAKMVNVNYHKIIDENKKKHAKKQTEFFIASVCPSIVALIKSKYPQYVPNLMPIVSPMVAMSRICKKYYPNHTPVFIGPCLTKKAEALEFKIPFALTFQELADIFKIYDQKKLWRKMSNIKKNKTFDKFYNDFTKIYPLSGALSMTLHDRELLAHNQVIIEDNHDFLKSDNPNIKFYDILFCNGGCIGGPGIISTEPVEKKKKKIVGYLKQSKREKIGRENIGKIHNVDNIDFSRKF
jgi:iron only hydrogenase large subunit-like protein